ncbi:Com family DNA-binding transcriptional regulator [Chitinimonas sp.]|uniref:Com family DNA-binding transcriptional regulator n=1 Tax=Chitinimonas sp. TaxID=1934313 RepID=UPI0035B33F37
MNEIRCGHCQRLLARAVFSKIEIKCPRCGTFNIQSAVSAMPERPLSVESMINGKPNARSGF